MDRPERSNGATRGAQARRGSGLGVLRKLFYFGLGVKRWLLVAVIGISISSIGLAFVIKNLFSLRLPELLPWYLEGVVIAGVGGVVMLLSIYGLYRSVGPLLFPSASIDTLADTIYTRRSRGRGPRIVAIGGGTGLSVLLRGVKAYTDNLTAIVTVADDGGSSGRLRRELGVLPPGDFRNCLVAMSDSEPLVRDLFQYRFKQGDGLEGHSFGNLFIAAMTSVTGSFEQALLESSQVLAVHGQILPATLANVRLSARLTDGAVVHGESSITERGGSIDQIFIDPQDADAYPKAVDAIKQAQLVLIGPGSLYTSILPNLLVSEIGDAISESAAAKVYVCNVATQKGETDRYTVSDHVEALQKHTFASIVDHVVVNTGPHEIGPPWLGEPVASDGGRLSGVSVISENVLDPDHPVRHDSDRLAQVIMDVYDGVRGSRAAKGTARQ